eukprot:TRINITY_DN723_c0_g1_i1.p1 TRINITY_DN723_c0_g1~~TRINITY_DN723_c0_g1_i1.p1  ORF type:complete len:671 (+),score=204.85 TRINITY_DN723_c0_g1_i1:515-2527(+)
MEPPGLNIGNFIDDVCEKPERFVAADSVLDEKISVVTKKLYDFAKQREPKKMSPLPELLLEGFDKEQVWEELQLQNLPMLRYLERQTRALLSNQNDLKLLPDSINLKTTNKKKRQQQEAPSSDDDAADDDDERPAGLAGSDDDDASAEDESGAEGELSGLEDDDDGKIADDDDGDDVSDDDDDDDTAAADADEGADHDDGDDDEFFASVKEQSTSRARAAAAAKGSDRFFSLDDMERFIDDAEQEDQEDDDEEDDGEDGDDDGEEDEADEQAGSGEEDGGSDADGDSDLDGADEDGAGAKYSDFFDPYDEARPAAAHDDLPLEMKMDLFERAREADDEKQQDSADLDWNKMTTYQKRMARLREKTEKLEKAHVAEKPWMLRGEVSSKDRPANSLLEATLDFERATKVAPVITEEVTNELEAIIKRRIKEQSWDDVIRKRQPVARKPRTAELDQEKSKLSLGEIYEKEYMKQVAGVREPSAHEKQQKEIEQMFAQLCHKLDSLSHFHYAPKPVLQQAEVHVNVPSIAMEEVMPVSVSSSTLLAPEEVYGKPKKETKGETELTQQQRQAARRASKAARQKQKHQKEVEKKEKEKAGLSKKSEKQSKAQAMKEISGQRNTKILTKGTESTGPTTSTALFKQLQGEARGEIVKKKRTEPAAKRQKLANTSNFKL